MPRARFWPAALEQLRASPLCTVINHMLDSPQPTSCPPPPNLPLTPVRVLCLSRHRMRIRGATTVDWKVKLKAWIKDKENASRRVPPSSRTPPCYRNSDLTWCVPNKTRRETVRSRPSAGLGSFALCLPGVHQVLAFSSGRSHGSFMGSARRKKCGKEKSLVIHEFFSCCSTWEARNLGHAAPRSSLCISCLW